MFAKDSSVLREYMRQEGKGHVSNTQPSFFDVLRGGGRRAREIQKCTRQDLRSKQGRFGSDIDSHIISSESTETDLIPVIATSKTELTPSSGENTTSIQARTDVWERAARLRSASPLRIVRLFALRPPEHL